MKQWITVRWVLAGIILICLSMGLADESAGKAVNSERPGREMDLKDHLVKGKINIVDFYSDYCPPCVKIAPLLAELDKKDEGKVVIKVDINRKGVEGIDWQSPLARQYNLQSIPHFRIYDEKLELVNEGRPAFNRILQWFQAADIELK